MCDLSSASKSNPLLVRLYLSLLVYHLLYYQIQSFRKEDGLSVYFWLPQAMILMIVSDTQTQTHSKDCKTPNITLLLYSKKLKIIYH